MTKITDKDLRKARGYDDHKIAKCICCGCDVEVTKFASEEKVKCTTCKDNGAPVNQQILDEIIANKKNKKSSKSAPSGNTKIVKCEKCGADVEISKFASAVGVLCGNCRGVGSTDDPTSVNIDLSKLDRNTIPKIEDYTIMPSIIKNERLQEVVCPACGHNTKILGILDYSDNGLIIHYQCTHCKLLISVSEQCDHICNTYNQGQVFDYSGNMVRDMVTALQHTRMGNALHRLIGFMQEHNIEINGIELPPYRTYESKPVPVGFYVSHEDGIIKMLDNVRTILSNAERTDTDGYIQIPNNIRDDIVNGITNLFKEE